MDPSEGSSVTCAAREIRRRRAEPLNVSSIAPQASRTSTSQGPVVAAAIPPASAYARTRERSSAARRQIGTATPSPALSPTGATAAPAPMPAPRSHAGGDPDRNRAERARIKTRPGRMETQAADKRSLRASQSPSAIDRKLCRGRSRQQVRRRNRPLELLLGQPLPLRHAQHTEQRDMRGRTTEPYTADPAPLPRNLSKRWLCERVGRWHW